VCSICHNPARREIESAVRSGAISLRAIARANGLSHQSIIRHRDNCRQLAPARHTHPQKWLSSELAANPGAICKQCREAYWWQETGGMGTGGCFRCTPPPKFYNARVIFFET
jgi:hypothetical protein